ncbi:MAG: outer membrane lipoprotein-sorting protein [Elusimicrobia bacterium]|nr:outer membrane lipoprotein-sorting protein [Candidatus Liberimonas magnetica]
MKNIFFASFMIAFLSINAYCESRVMPILKTIEKIYELKGDGRANVLLTQQKVGQGTKIIEMLYYRRDSDNSFLIIMSAPENEKGNGYLRVGDNFWMYRKNTRTFQHINRDENIGGSDAHGGDFENRKLTEMYAPALDKDSKEIISEEVLGQIPVYKFEAKAIINDVDYPKKTYWVRKDNNLILKEESYSMSGTLMQTAYYIKYTIIDGRYMPVKQIFVDEFEKGNKTIVDISSIIMGKLEDSIFTKAYLENLSK